MAFLMTMQILGLRVRQGYQELKTNPDRGAISTELVVITIGLFVLAGIIIAALTAWAQGKLGELG